MASILNPLDQLIAARVKVRFASLSKRADPIDINDYPKALRGLKAADPLLSGLKTTTDKYKDAAKKALDEFATSVDQIPSGLEKLGINPKGIQRYHTQLVNLIKVAKKGEPLRAYSTFSSDAPLKKVDSVISSLVKTALKSSGAGTKILKPALVANYMTKEVVGPFESVKSACDDWFEFVGSAASKIDKLVMDAWWVSPEPYSSGFTLTPEYEEYAKAQRVFAKQSRDLVDTVRHNIIGLPMAASGFEDCVDIDLCLSTAIKALDEALKVNLEFGKKWGDFRAKNQAQESGQKSLFARAVKQQM